MKASEVFNLPLMVGYVEPEAIFNSNENYLVEFPNKDMSCCAVNCINHADALADALAIVLEAHFSKGGVTTDVAASALESLKAYVGEGE